MTDKSRDALLDMQIPRRFIVEPAYTETISLRDLLDKYGFVLMNAEFFEESTEEARQDARADQRARDAAIVRGKKFNPASGPLAERALLTNVQLESAATAIEEDGQ